MMIDLQAMLSDARAKREYYYSIFVGIHDRPVQLRDTIAFTLYSRCLQAHEAIETLASHSLFDDAWVLLRSMVEHAINSAYMLVVADEQTASDFADYGKYTDYKYLRDIKGTDERAFRQQVSVETEEKARVLYEQVRARYDSRRGMDKWCPDGPLHKRAERVDNALNKRVDGSPLLWLANTAWRIASAHTHGAASVLAEQVQPIQETRVTLQRIYGPEEAVAVVNWANFALYLISILIDVALGSKNVAEIEKRNTAWAETLTNAKAESGTAQGAS
jgi:uncharacterized protein DUF5677